MTSCAEWTGVLLSTLLKEAGVQAGADWIVAEGVEEVKGASSIPMTKAMDDCSLAYGMNGEAVSPQRTGRINRYFRPVEAGADAPCAALATISQFQTPGIPPEFTRRNAKNSCFSACNRTLPCIPCDRIVVDVLTCWSVCQSLLPRRQQGWCSRLRQPGNW